MKEEHLPLAHSVFGDIGVQFTTEGRRYLGAAVGSSDFVKSYVSDKVKRTASAASSAYQTWPLPMDLPGLFLPVIE